MIAKNSMCLPMFNKKKCDVEVMSKLRNNYCELGTQCGNADKSRWMYPSFSSNYGKVNQAIENDKFNDWTHDEQKTPKTKCYARFVLANRTDLDKYRRLGMNDTSSFVKKSIDVYKCTIKPDVLQHWKRNKDEAKEMNIMGDQGLLYQDIPDVLEFLVVQPANDRVCKHVKLALICSCRSSRNCSNAAFKSSSLRAC